MKTVRMKIDVQSPNVTPIGRIDVKRVDATTTRTTGRIHVVFVWQVEAAKLVLDR